MWMIVWNDELMPLAYVTDADELLGRAFGIGIAEYQRRHHPATLGQSPEV
jgi:hypothetical protein